MPGSCLSYRWSRDAPVRDAILIMLLVEDLTRPGELVSSHVHETRAADGICRPRSNWLCGPCRIWHCLWLPVNTGAAPYVLGDNFPFVTALTAPSPVIPVTLSNGALPVLRMYLPR